MGNYTIKGKIKDADGNLKEISLPIANPDIDGEIKKIWAAINYVAPTIASLEVVIDGTTYSSNASFEVSGMGGATKSITGVKHQETNSENITESGLSLSVTINEEENVPVKVDASEELKTVERTEKIPIDTPGVVKITLSGTGIKNENLSKSITITVYCPSFIGVSTETSPSTDLFWNLTKISSANLKGTRTITLSEGGYIWFVSTTAITKITSAGIDVPFTEVNSSFSHLGGSYHCYKTDNMITSGTYTFIIT